MSQSGTGYIQVEGVNIYDTLGDTRQLSVIRGGCFLLKEAIDAVASEFKEALKPISTGASVGVFKVAAHIESAEQLDSTVHQIAAFLKQSPWHCLTFTVVSHRRMKDESYPLICDQLQALGRFQQLQQLNMAPDYLPDEGEAFDQVCTTDRFRPADSRGESASVRTRYEKGTAGRKGFLQQSLGGLHQLAAFGPEGCQEITLTRSLEAIGDNPAMGSLHNKLALVYVDGNGFGDIKRRLIQSAEDQARFDTFLQTQRQALLDDWCALLFEHMKQNRDAFSQLCYEDKANGEVQLRFEALLWGGDELLFVVPAWQGLTLLSFLYQQTRRWRLPESKAPESEPPESKDQTFKHAAGLVFCKANAPIFRIRDLARQLADQVKERGGRKHDRFDYCVLESIDYPTVPVEQFQTRLYGAQLAARNSGFSVPETATLARWPALLAQLPKAQIYKLATTVCQDGGMGEATKQQQARLGQLIGPQLYDKTLLMLLKDSFGEQAVASGRCWVLLRELWDYLACDFVADAAACPGTGGND